MRISDQIRTSPLRHLIPLKIDRYLIREVGAPFLGGLIFLSFVFLMFQLLRLAEYFIVHSVPVVTLAEIIWLMILSFLPFSLPVAFLIAILTSFGRLSTDSELVALKANGVSVWRMSFPVLLLALGVGIFSLALSFDWVPWGELRYRDLIIRVGNTKATSSIKEGTFTTGFFDLLVYTDEIDGTTNRMKHVFIFDEREPKNPLTIIAKQGEVLPVRPNPGQAAAIVLRLSEGNIHRNDIKENTYQRIDFDEYRLYLSVAEGAGGVSRRPRIIRQNDLVKAIDDPGTEERWKMELQIEYWRRYAVLVTPFLFVFLGIGFGTFRTRAVRAGAAIVGLATVLVLWGLQALMTSAAHKGWVSPFVASWIPNLVLGGAAYFGFRTAMW